MTNFEAFHRSFSGDTYATCVKCGGRCEKLKIATLLPGEKEYMTETLHLPAEAMADCLDQIETPAGLIDVIKLTGPGCRFLDPQYKCTAIPAKPVLCDVYPLVFRVADDKILFDLLDEDCPAVRRNDKFLLDIIDRAEPALCWVDAPLEWWQAVGLLDPYDFDYDRMEKDLRKRSGKQAYLLEDILAFRLTR